MNEQNESPVHRTNECDQRFNAGLTERLSMKLTSIFTDFPHYIFSIHHSHFGLLITNHSIIFNTITTNNKLYAFNVHLKTLVLYYIKFFFLLLNSVDLHIF